MVALNGDLVAAFKPKAEMLGLDALSVNPPDQTECVSRLSHVGAVPVEDISLANGMVTAGTFVPYIPAQLPFGGRIPLYGKICPDVDRFRVVYRETGTSDPWEPIKVLGSKGWTLKTDAFLPSWPDCLGTMAWSSDGDGWYDAADYRAQEMIGCNSHMPLTVWESAAAVGGDDKLYELILELETTSTVVSDTTRLVQLDNDPPDVEIAKTTGTCDAFTGSDMPLTIRARMNDPHFYRYRLQITGNWSGIRTYSVGDLLRRSARQRHRHRDHVVERVPELGSGHGLRPGYQSHRLWLHGRTRCRGWKT